MKIKIIDLINMIARKDADLPLILKYDNYIYKFDKSIGDYRKDGYGECLLIRRLYKVDEIIAYISKFFTLKTGDILYTGTPMGVGPVHIDDHLTGYIEDRKVLEFNVQ